MTTLRRVPATRLWLEEGTPPPRTGAVAFWIASLDTPPPDVLTPGDAWFDPALLGHLVFLRDLPTDGAALAMALEKGGVLPTPLHTSLAWLGWDSAAGAITSVQRAEMKPAAGGAALAATAPLLHGTYGIRLIAETPALPNGTRAALAGLTFTYPAFPGAPPSNGQGLALPFDGASRFCLTGLSLMSDFAADAKTGWDVSLRYYFERGGRIVGLRYPLLEPDAPGLTRLFRVTWDPLDASATGRTRIDFTGVAYELVPRPGETPPWRIQASASGTLLSTRLRTVFGDVVAFTPLTQGGPGIDPARFVLQPVPGPDGKPAGFALVPAGDFELRVAPSPSRAAVDDAVSTRLLLGLAGTETAGLVLGSGAASGDIVRFHPDRAAFAPRFPLVPTKEEAAGRPRIGAVSNEELLTNRFVTAWAGLRAGEPGAGSPNAGSLNTADPTYFAEPEASPLFEPGGAAVDAILKPALVPAGSFTPTTPAFPLAVYSGVSGEGPALDDVKRFEAQILAPTRRALVGDPQLSRRARDLAGTKTTTTPQGFLVDLDGARWTKILIAKNKTSPAGDPPSTELELAFLNPTDKLREAFQSSEMFLVASDPAALGTFQKTIPIVDWPFTLNVSGSSLNYRNVLIFKFVPGPLVERVRKPESWTLASDFNRDPADVATWIDAYFAAAEQQAPVNARLLPFVELIRSATWQGVLALRVDIGLQSFPPDLRGLLAGIDLARFEAHHLGLELSFVEPGPTLTMPPKSSLFALIDYVDRDVPASAASRAFVSRNGGGPLPRALATAREEATADPQYDFRVANLQVVFRKSQILDFASRILVTLRSLFGDAVVRADQPESPVLQNTVLLRGSYEDHGGVPFYSFQGDRAVRFLANASPVLDYVELVKSQFHTFRPGDGNAGGLLADTGVASRFSFWGWASFRKLEGVDLLSFGEESETPAGPPRGVYFSELGLRMTFDLSTPTDRTFTFQAAGAALDLSLSTPRPGSLFSGFPLKLSGFDQGGPGRSTGDAGYLPVRAEKLVGAAPLSPDWFGLVFGLNLGSMGALAEAAGFTASLGVAWSPGGTRPRVSLLMRLPGASAGKKELSLQSVLKLGVSELVLTAEAENPLAFLLELRGIGLFFLGKKLPSAAVTNLTLFGDPDSGSGSLAWYGAYFKPAANAARDDA